MNDKLSQTDKTVFISGAAGGLGTVLVKKYAAHGYRVIATDIDSGRLSIFNGLDHVTTWTLDVTDPGKIKSLAGEMDINVHGLDVLVCLAGIYDTYPVTEAGPELLQSMIAVNFLGTAALIQVFLAALMKRQGRVIVVSSESYKVQAMFQPYMISKAALETYCRVARQELSLKGIDLSVIRPGAIRTPLLKWMDLPYEPGKYPVFSRELGKSHEKSMKMVGRIVDPEKVAVLIIKASMASKPRRVYCINNNPLLTLVSLVPPGVLDRLIVRMFK